MINTDIPFFKTKTVLASNNYKVNKTSDKTIQAPLEYLQQLSGEYFVLAKLYNKLVFGILSDGVFAMSDGEVLDPKYLINIRAFNDKEEVLFELRRKNWHMTRIQDEKTSEEELDNYIYSAVDSTSPIFGDCVSNNDGFAELVEKGRKISLKVPFVEGEGLYGLHIRSYIEYSETTGQAGFGFFRFVALERV